MRLAHPQWYVETRGGGDGGDHQDGGGDAVQVDTDAEALQTAAQILG
jgi:hypothetical protein